MSRAQPTGPFARLLAGFLALLAGLALGEDALAQDQVFVQRARDGALSVESGKVLEDGLERVLLQQGGKETRIDSGQVQRVSFGDVPPSYRDGLAFFERGDWENAVARLRIAATDADARPPVQASARLLASEALLRWGASDPAHLREAALESERFLQAYPQNRELPRARLLRARAVWLSGDATRAAAELRELWQDAKAGKAGYGQRIGYEACAWAIEASLEASDTLAARELSAELASATESALAALQGASPERHVLERLRAFASLGEGFAQIAGGQARQAIGFFETRTRELAGKPGDAAAAYGYGKALLAEGRAEEARHWLARASALESTDRDRIAAALLLLAESAAALPPHQDGDPKLWLREIVATYGDTPAARAARSKL